MTHVSFDFFALFTDDCTCIKKIQESIKIQDIKNLLSFLDKKKNIVKIIKN